jgi:hypothetical protein
VIAHGLPLPHGHLPGFGVSVHVRHLLLVAMLAADRLGALLQSRRGVLFREILEPENP